jgi:hypothetical protein
VIDRYGAQEYFDTLKLQFGFTLRGALRRLPEWLDGLGPPIAVRILTGAEVEYTDLNSSSFITLWRTLQDFRRNRVAEEYAHLVVTTSPWVRPAWDDELLGAARLRLNRPGHVPTTEPSVVERSIEPVCEPILRWEDSAKPHLLLRLNEERIYEILAESHTAAFLVDGRFVDRWTAQEGGVGEVSAIYPANRRVESRTYGRGSCPSRTKDR